MIEEIGKIFFICFVTICLFLLTGLFALLLADAIGNRHERIQTVLYGMIFVVCLIADALLVIKVMGW